MPRPCHAQMVEVYVPEQGTHGLVLYTVMCVRTGTDYFIGIHYPNGGSCSFKINQINRILKKEEYGEAYNTFKNKTQKEANYEY